MKILDFAGRHARNIGSGSRRGSACLPLTGTYRVGGQATASSAKGPFHLTATNHRASYVELLPDSSFTFGQLETLFVVFHSYSGGAAMGSPRVSITLIDDTETERPVVIYLGNPPNFLDSDTALNQYSGLNLMSDNNADRFDTSAFPNGSPFATYADALKLVARVRVKNISFFLDTVGTLRNRDEMLYSIGGSVVAPQGWRRPSD